MNFSFHNFSLRQVALIYDNGYDKINFISSNLDLLTHCTPVEIYWFR